MNRKFQQLISNTVNETKFEPEKQKRFDRLTEDFEDKNCISVQALRLLYVRREHFDFQIRAGKRLNKSIHVHEFWKTNEQDPFFITTFHREVLTSRPKPTSYFDDVLPNIIDQLEFKNKEDIKALLKIYTEFLTDKGFVFNNFIMTNSVKTDKKITVQYSNLVSDDAIFIVIYLK